MRTNRLLSLQHSLIYRTYSATSIRQDLFGLEKFFTKKEKEEKVVNVKMPDPLPVTEETKHLYRNHQGYTEAEIDRHMIEGGYRFSTAKGLMPPLTPEEQAKIEAKRNAFGSTGKYFMIGFGIFFAWVCYFWDKRQLEKRNAMVDRNRRIGYSQDYDTMVARYPQFKDLIRGIFSKGTKLTASDDIKAEIDSAMESKDQLVGYVDNLEGKSKNSEEVHEALIEALKKQKE